MKIYTRIKNILFLRKALKHDLSADLQFQNAVAVGRHFYKNSTKGGFERNLFAAFIKKYRAKFPYYIKGWAQNEKLYKEYDKINGAIKSLQEVKQKQYQGDVYVTMFRAASVYKGEKLCEYNSVGTFLKEPVTFKVGRYRKSTDSFRLSDDTFFTLDEEWMRAFMYATEQEIEDYKVNEIRREKVQLQIKEKQTELSNLYKQL